MRARGASMLCASRRTRTEPRTRTESPRRARGRNQVDRRRFGGRPLCQVVTASNRRDWLAFARALTEPTGHVSSTGGIRVCFRRWFGFFGKELSAPSFVGTAKTSSAMASSSAVAPAARRVVASTRGLHRGRIRGETTKRPARAVHRRRVAAAASSAEDAIVPKARARHGTDLVRSIDASASLVGTVVLRPRLTPPRALPAHPPHPPGLQSPRRRQHRRRRAARRRQASRVRLSRQGARALGGERARAVRRRVRERRRRVRGRHRRGLARRRRARAQRRVRRRRRDRVVRGNDRVPFGAVEGWERTGGDGFRFRRVLYAGPHTTASAW